MGFGIVVIACAHERALRNATVGADRNWLQIENENFFSNPGKIAKSKFPGKVDVNTRLDNNPCTYASTKGPQQGTL
jgi:hypothetical protein